MRGRNPRTAAPWRRVEPAKATVDDCPDHGMGSDYVVDGGMLRRRGWAEIVGGVRLTSLLLVGSPPGGAETTPPGGPLHYDDHHPHVRDARIDRRPDAADPECREDRGGAAGGADTVPAFDGGVRVEGWNWCPATTHRFIRLSQVTARHLAGLVAGFPSSLPITTIPSGRRFTSSPTALTPRWGSQADPPRGNASGNKPLPAAATCRWTCSGRIGRRKSFLPKSFARTAAHPNSCPRGSATFSITWSDPSGPPPAVELAEQRDQFPRGGFSYAMPILLELGLLVASLGR